MDTLSDCRNGRDQNNPDSSFCTGWGRDPGAIVELAGTDDKVPGSKHKLIRRKHHSELEFLHAKEHCGWPECFVWRRSSGRSKDLMPCTFGCNGLQKGFFGHCTRGVDSCCGHSGDPKVTQPPLGLCTPVFSGSCHIGLSKMLDASERPEYPALSWTAGSCVDVCRSLGHVEPVHES